MFKLSIENKNNYTIERPGKRKNEIIINHVNYGKKFLFLLYTGPKKFKNIYFNKFVSFEIFNFLRYFDLDIQLYV